MCKEAKERWEGALLGEWRVVVAVRVASAGHSGMDVNRDEMMDFPFGGGGVSEWLGSDVACPVATWRDFSLI